MAPSSIVVIGVSHGGVRTLPLLLSQLQPDFALPIAIVQHRSIDADGGLLRFLNQSSVLPIVEAEDKQPLNQGIIYLAPADYHLLIEDGHAALSTEAPVNSARPSIDVLFESAAHAYGCQAIGVVLTGASSDGANGLAAIAAAGGTALVQDPATAESKTMPEAALAATSVAHVGTIKTIGALLNHFSATGGQFDNATRAFIKA